MIEFELLDLFCGAGGSSVGYTRAGLHVTGCDIDLQPSFPLAFFQERALDVDLTGYHAVHASPPCQRFSTASKHSSGHPNEWPDLIGPIREKFIAAGIPYVIENVVGAPLDPTVRLCGTMFPGLRVIRHRLFECSFPVPEPYHPKHPKVHTHDRRKAHFGHTDEWSDFVQVTGGGNCSVEADAMGITWPVTKHDLNEALPPAYTEYIGRILRRHLREIHA